MLETRDNNTRKETISLKKETICQEKNVFLSYKSEFKCLPTDESHISTKYLLYCVTLKCLTKYIIHT